MTTRNNEWIFQCHSSNDIECSVIGGDTWVHHHTLEAKYASMEWKQPGSKSPKTFHIVRPSGKVKAAVFWDHKGILLIAMMKQGKTINVVTYYDTLTHLSKPFNEMLCFCIIVHHFSFSFPFKK
jgi:hypothetical protein